MTPESSIKEKREQMRRMWEQYERFSDFTYLPPKTKYVGLKDDGEVELEEIGQPEQNEEEIYE